MQNQLASDSINDCLKKMVDKNFEITVLSTKIPVKNKIIKTLNQNIIINLSFSKNIHLLNEYIIANIKTDTKSICSHKPGHKK